MEKKLSLRALVREYARSEFEWGVHDCCQFVAKHISNVLQNGNYADNYSYKTAAEAQGYLDRDGGVAGIASNAIGYHETDCDLEIGDVCVVRLPVTGDALAICSSAGAIVPSERGLITVPKNRIMSGWRL